MSSKLSLRRSFRGKNIFFYVVFAFILLAFIFVPTIITPMFAQEKKKEEKQEDIEDFSLEDLLNVEIISARKGTESISETTKVLGKLKGKNLIFSNELRNKYKNKRWKVYANLLINEKGSIRIVKILTILPADLKNYVIRRCSKWKYISAQKSTQTGKLWISIAFTIKL